MSRPTLPDVPWEGVNERERALPMKKAGMVVDLRRCIGCHGCSVSCKTEHSVPLGEFRTRVRYLPRPDRPQLSFLPLLCMHCQDAPCLDACPTEAVVRLEDGRVTIDQDRCCGNKACVSACPYGAIAINEATGLADKCDLCTNRTSMGMEPSCVDACPTEALRFGDLGDPKSAIAKYAREHKASAFKPDANTDPVVLYVGNEPWMEKAAASGVQLAPGDDEIVYEQR